MIARPRMINKNPEANGARGGTNVVISPNPGASPVLHLLRRHRDNGADTDIDNVTMITVYIILIEC